MYGHTARVLGMEVRLVPMTDGFHLDIPAMDIALEGAAVCFLARPNNPTGVLWDADVVHGLMARHPETLFVIDEAYVAYAPGASLWSTQVRPNHIHMQTLSKVGGAALRVGYCIAHPELALALHKVRHPYNVSATSLAFAEALLARFEDEGRALVQRTLAGRDRIRTLLCELEGATVYPSAANLVLVRLPGSEDAPKLRAHLATRGILIKDVSRSPGLERCVRVSVGTAAEIDRLEAALRAWSR
jgi:histidinol-phosphate/aromatic aminotransferase/cobyric acid decarboxylase-like protein